MTNDHGFPPHFHACRVCGLGSAWCCRHRWTLGYIAAVVTLLLLMRLADAFLGWPS